MRFIKNVENSIRVIAGEMINIEMSALCFIDGKFVGAKNVVKGYPKIVSDGAINDVKASLCAVWVPSGIDNDIFPNQLYLEMVKMFTEMGISDYSHLQTYHTINSGAVTNIKVCCQSKRTFVHGVGKPILKKCIRVITPERVMRREYTKARFVWVIKVLDARMFNGTNVGIDIVYDKNDVFNCAHNDVLYNIVPRLLRGLSGELYPTIKTFGYGDILLSELYGAKPSLYNIRNNVQYVDYVDVVYPAPNGDVDEGHRVLDRNSTTCTECNMNLYGDVYFTVSCDGLQKSLAGTAKVYCPMCIHGPAPLSDAPIFRTKLPLTARSVIEAMEPSNKRCVLLAAARGHKRVNRHVDHNFSIDYFVFGDEYIMFDNVNAYLFTDMVNDPELKKYKVCYIA